MPRSHLLAVFKFLNRTKSIGMVFSTTQTGSGFAPRRDQASALLCDGRVRGARIVVGVCPKNRVAHVGQANKRPGDCRFARIQACDNKCLDHTVFITDSV